MEAVIIIGIIVAVLVVGFLLWRAPHPEDISGHESETPADTRSERVYGYAERPAGPDAEAMGVAGPGDPVAGDVGDVGDQSDRPDRG